MPDAYDKLTIGMTEAILESVSSGYKEIGNRTYLFLLNDVKVVLRNSGTSLSLQASFQGNHSLSKINEWNENRRFTRGYVEMDGSVNLEADYLLDGGFTIENLANFIRIFSVSLDTFVKEVA